MKNHLTLLLASVLLVFTLTACGGDKKNGAVDNDIPPVTDGNIIDNGNTDLPNDANGNDPADNGPAENNDALNNPLDNTPNDTLDNRDDTLIGNGTDTTVKQTQRMGGVSYGQMLRNARVHDADGDLTDYENAVTPGAARLY